MRLNNSDLAKATRSIHGTDKTEKWELHSTISWSLHYTHAGVSCRSTLVNKIQVYFYLYYIIYTKKPSLQIYAVTYE